MCLTRDSLRRYGMRYGNREGTREGREGTREGREGTREGREGTREGREGFAPDDWELACTLFDRMWQRLDHQRTYCLNPRILAAEILQRAGRGEQPHVRRLGGEKGAAYRRTIDLMWGTVAADHAALGAGPVAERAA
jgi:hypothetical protein